MCLFFLICLFVGFVVFLVVFLMFSLVFNQVIYIFKLLKNFILLFSWVVSICQFVNCLVVVVVVFEVIDCVFSMIGIFYCWGGIMLKKGFDCSGLVNYVFQDVDDVDLLWIVCVIYNMDNNKVFCGKL